MNKSISILLHLFLTALLGASLGIAGKFALEYFNWKTTLVRRAIFSFLFLFPFIIRSLKASYFKERQFWLLGITSLANIFLYIYGVQFTTAGMAQLMYLSIPFSTSFLALFLLNTKPDNKQVIGMIVCSVGVLFLQSKNVLVSEGISLYGNLIILLAASTHALYIVMSKKYQDRYNVRSRVGSFVFVSLGLPIFMPLFFESSLGDILPLSSPVLILGFLGACSLGLHLMTQLTNQKFGATISSCVLYIQPLLGVIIAYLVLNEQITPLAIVGGLITMFGAFLISKQ